MLSIVFQSRGANLHVPSRKKLNYHKKANFTERYTLFTEFTENFSSENEDKNLENEREIR